MPIVKLQSSDGQVFPVDSDVAKIAGTVRTMMEEGMGANDEVIPLPDVTGPILKKVIQWVVYHRDNPFLFEEFEGTNDIGSWDLSFLKVDHGTLFELILAANYLDVKGLVDVTCKRVASLLKGKTPAEIRKTFSIRNDFPPGREDQLRKESKWCEDN